MDHAHYQDNGVFLKCVGFEKWYTYLSFVAVDRIRSSCTCSQPLVYIHTFPFIPNMILFSNSNNSTRPIMFPLTLCTIHEYKTDNDVSEFMHSNWITLSYYSSPNTRVWFLNIWYTSLTSVHNNLEQGVAILTESFSPLRSVLHNLCCWSPNQKWCDKPLYSLLNHVHWTGLNQFTPATANYTSKWKADVILV